MSEYATCVISGLRLKTPEIRRHFFDVIADLMLTDLEVPKKVLRKAITSEKFPGCVGIELEGFYGHKTVFWVNERIGTIQIEGDSMRMHEFQAMVKKANNTAFSRIFRDTVVGQGFTVDKYEEHTQMGIRTGSKENEPMMKKMNSNNLADGKIFQGDSFESSEFSQRTGTYMTLRRSW